MYPVNVTEKAEKLRLALKVATLKADLAEAEEELLQFNLRIHRRDAE